ncbi:MAG: sarcosine oxidase subunit gamma family protein [Pseudomonadota bacterium]
MSDRQPASLGAATVAAAPPIGMIALKADLADTGLAAALLDATGLAVPQIRRASLAGENTALWFAPDEVLILTPDAAAATARLGAALSNTHHLLADVSGARLRFFIDGPAARDLLAKGAPVDFAPDRFRAGDFRRTRLGQLAAAIWCMAPARFCLFCHRSVGQHVELWLETAAASGAAGLYRRSE